MRHEADENREMEAKVGRLVADRYRLDAVIGTGGMGAVYRATHVLLDKEVAVKILRPNMATSRDIAARFRQEAKTVANIRHPNICGATDFGQTKDGELFLVMELLHGRSLRGELDSQGALGWRRAVGLARQICGALRQAHELDIVHRDVKPENVMLVEEGGDPDFVKLLDFGIARVGSLRHARAFVTQDGAIYGTLEYIAPEQAAGAEVDGRADLYALGVVLFEMLTGRLPFPSEDRVALIRMHMMRQPPTVGQFAPKLPLELSELVAKLLRKSPDDRYQKASELMDDLNALLEREREEEPRRAPSWSSLESATLDSSAPTIDLELEVPDVVPRIGRLVPREIATRYAALAIWQEGERLVVAMTDPSDTQAIAEIEFLTGFSVDPIRASQEVIDTALSRLYNPAFEQ